MVMFCVGIVFLLGCGPEYMYPDYEKSRVYITAAFVERQSTN